MTDIYLILTYSTTQFKSLRHTWQVYESLKRDIQAFGTTRQDEETCGGKVVILNWKTKKIEKIANIPRSSGILSWNKGFLIGAYDKILLLDLDLNVCDQVDHPLFNNIHGLCVMSDGIAVSSTGIDTILFLDQRLAIYDYWCAIEHGFTIDQLGNPRHINLDDDHRSLMYPTLLHTTHLNSLLWIDKDEHRNGRLYATFFHQGTVEEITDSGATKTILKDLSAPHAISRLSDGRYMVADSANNRVVIWSENENSIGKKVYFINLPTCNWIQDVKECKSRGSYFIADCNHCRILEVDESGTIIDRWSYNEDWKVQEMMII
jgi:hypothetical protein